MAAIQAALAAITRGRPSTTAPTGPRHPCDDGSHSCDTRHGTCYKNGKTVDAYGSVLGSQSDWVCGCVEGFHCARGCMLPHLGHTCAVNAVDHLEPLLSSAPSSAPTLSPTAAPTVSPTAAPTVSPTSQPTHFSIAGIHPATFRSPVRRTFRPPTRCPTPSPSLSPSSRPSMEPLSGPTPLPPLRGQPPPFASADARKAQQKLNKLEAEAAAKELNPHMGRTAPEFVLVRALPASFVLARKLASSKTSAGSYS